MSVAIVSATDDDFGQQFVHALMATGFAIVRGAPITAAIVSAANDVWLEFFAQPLAAKRRYHHECPGQAPLCGYWSSAESETAVGATVADLKEFFHVLPGATLPPGVGRSTYRYRELALDLGRSLLSAIAEGDLAERLSSADSVLRAVYYPPFDGSEAPDAIRAAAHEDINLLTILPVADEPGLEILDKQGRWRSVAGQRGDIVVNAGDMLAEVSGGRFPSTTHRVVNPDDPTRPRLALPLFLTPTLDTVLSSRYTAGAYLAERLQAISGGSQRLAGQAR